MRWWCIAGLIVAVVVVAQQAPQQQPQQADKSNRVIAGIRICPQSLGVPKTAKLKVRYGLRERGDGKKVVFGEALVAVKIDGPLGKEYYDYSIRVYPSVATAKNEPEIILLIKTEKSGWIPLDIKLFGIDADKARICFWWYKGSKKKHPAALDLRVRNVWVMIEPRTPAAEENLFLFARKVAAYLRKQPTYKSLQASGLCPKIIAKPEKTVVTAEKGSVTMPDGSTKPSYHIEPVKVDFRVEDPQNLKVKVRHICYTEGQGDAAFGRCFGRTGFYLTWHLFLEKMKGRVKCRVVFTAVNERLLWTTKEITITINPPKK